MSEVAGGGKILVELKLDDGHYTIGVKNAGQLMQEFKRTLDQTATSVKKVEEHTSSMGRRFRDLVLTLGNLRFVAMDINDVFLRLPMSILKTAGELERMQQLMTGLSKETEKFKKPAEGLADFNFVVGMAKNAPFEISALSDAFVKLKTAGINPTNGSMQALVDSVARFGGTSESLKRASIAIQQMSGKGVISMEELRQQLGEAIPDAMKNMADGLGMTVAQLAKVVSTGTLQAEGALKKMLLQMRIANMGAAEDMMTTWVGATARLKTEWDLTAKFIADSGFGNEAKRVVSDLTAVLQNDEFRRFASDAGQSLGELVRDFMGLMQTAIKFREEIGYLVEAFIAYKVIGSIVRPMSLSLKEGWENTTRSMHAQIGALSDLNAKHGVVHRFLADKALENRARLIEEATQERQRVIAAQRNSADIIINKRGETAAIVAENAKIKANYDRLNAALEAAEIRNRSVRFGGGTMSQKDASAALRDMERAMDSNSAKVRANMADIIAHGNAVANSREEAKKKGEEIKRLTSHMGIYGTAARGAAAATQAFGAVLNFMGGWVGVAITAIALLVSWYESASAAADKFAAAKRRASLNLSTEDDRALTKKNYESASKEYDDAVMQSQTTRKFVVSPLGGGVWVDKTEQEQAADIKRRNELHAKKMDAYKAMFDTERSLMEQGARDTAQAQQVVTDRKLRDLEAEGRREIAAIEAERVKVIGASKLSEEAKLAEDQKFVKRKNEAFMRNLQARIKEETRVINEAELAAKDARVGTKERIAQEEIIKARESSRRMLETELQGVKDALAAKIEHKPKTEGGAGGPKESPYQKELEKLKEQAAKLKATIDGFDDVTAKGDAVAGAMAEMRQRILDGDFGKDLTAAQRTELLNLTAQVANQKKTLDEMEEQAKRAAKVTDQIESMRPDFEDAMRMLADPLGTATGGAGAKESSANRWIAKNMDEVRAYADKQAMSVEQVLARIRNLAQAADGAALFQKAAQETKQINDSIVEDSRFAAAARMAADNERHAAEMRNLYEKRVASGQATEGELLYMRRIMEQSAVARARRLEVEMRSPLEKLATQWGEYAKNMEEASAGWANSTMAFMTELVTKGKADFKGLVTSILTDMARLKMQEALSPLLNIGANLLMGALGVSMPSATPAATPIGAPANYGLSSGSGLGLKAGGFAFANGGIMTEFGSAPLRKYAAGGVAKSPQLALFGEGSMPEAYVPLPDGRTIPVTINAAGGNKGDVQVNITVHQNGSETSSTKGNADAFKKMGERIKVVVREELASQARPGGMLYR